MRKPANIQKYFLHKVAVNLYGHTRVRVCRRFQLPKEHVKIMHDYTHNKAFYANLMTCGLGWICPICGSKIAERRGEEMIEGSNNFHGTVMMFTVTLRHNKSDGLKDLINTLSDAYRYLTHGREWQNFKKMWGWQGMVSNLEIKWGYENGWHPHKHLLMFFDSDLCQCEANEITRQLQERYTHYLIKCGGSGIRRILFSASDLKHTKRNAEIVAEYVAKWGEMPYSRQWSVESEMTQSHKKHAGHLTYYQLLELYAFLEPGSKDQQKIHEVLKEYQEATKGEKILVYSRGLRDLLGIGPGQTDKEIATETKEDASLLAWICDDLWKKIRFNELRGHVLEYATQFPDEIKDYLKYIDQNYQSKREGTK